MKVLKKLKESAQDKVFDWQKKKLETKIMEASKRGANRRQIAKLKGILEQLDPKEERKGSINFQSIINVLADMGEAGQRMTNNLVGSEDNNQFSDMVEQAKKNNET